MIRRDLFFDRQSKKRRYHGDASGRVSAVSYDRGDGKKTYSYAYHNDDLISSITLPGTGTVTNTYDTLSRRSAISVKPFSGSGSSYYLNTALTYIAGAGTYGTTGLVATYMTLICLHKWGMLPRMKRLWHLR